MAQPSYVPRDELPARTRAPRGFVVRDPAVVDGEGSQVDWSQWYVTDEDDMGESFEHGEIIRVLLSCLAQWARECGWANTVCASDQFFAWLPDHPLVRVSPDVYLLDDPPPPPRPSSWQTWLAGHRPPRFALEIVSEEWKKDYEEGPQKYAQLGCRELVIFDPERALSSSSKQGSARVVLQVYRRAPDGALVRVYAGPGPARSDELGAWLVAHQQDHVVRLRIARDASGNDRVPTEAEALEAERHAREAERHAREAAQRRIRELEEKLREKGE